MNYQQPADEYALIIQRSTGAQLVLNSLLRLLLSFQYGLQIMMARSMPEARRRLELYPGQIRCIFALEDAEDSEFIELAQDKRPLFLVLPEQLTSLHMPALKQQQHIYLCPQERAFTKGEDALTPQVQKAFVQCGVEDLLGANDHLVANGGCERVARRVGKLHTLPTLPEVVLHVMELIDDPTSSIDDLEGWLLKDPSLVLKVQQVINSPDFAPTSMRLESMTLHESIVRLGLERVGVITQQIQLMNTLAKPHDSPFDMDRFWKHCLACALITDRLVGSKLVHLQQVPTFSAYWMTSLLHDIGKIVLGFFFPLRYGEIRACMRETPGLSFRKAEAQLGDIATHDYLGRIMLLKSGVSIELVEAVGFHHSVSDTSPSLAHLIHLANELSKDIGLGYCPGERSKYSARSMRHLKLDVEELKNLREIMRDGIGQSVENMLSQCRPNAE